MRQVTAESGIGELERRRTTAAGLGGPDRVQRQHDRGFLTARERVELLLDPGTQVPFGPLVNSGVPGEEHRTMGDGQLMGFGRIEGRWVSYSASDATIKGGSGGAGSMRRGKAFGNVVSAAGLPKFGLAQGGGARITDIVSSRFSGFPGPSTMGRHLGFPRRGAALTAVMGNYYAPWTVADADYRLMTEGSNFSISSPPIVEEATGEVVTPFELGGRDVHAKITGEIDNIVPDDAAAIAQLRRVFSYFPANAWQDPPVVRTGDPPDRIEESLRTLVPEQPQRPFNVKKAINAVVDRDSFIEWMADYAKQLVCGIARVDGHTVCVIGNQTAVRAGSLDVKSSIKVRRMLRVAQAIRCPTVAFIDVPGVLPTIEEEHQRLLQGLIDMFAERNALSQPTIGIHLRKGYGAAIWAMHGADPEWYSMAWPSAQIAFVGTEPGVRVAYRKEWQAAEDKDAFIAEHAKVIQKNSEPWLGADMDFIDDVIDSAQTRPILVRALATARASATPNDNEGGSDHMPEQNEPSGLERVFAEQAAVAAFDSERTLGPGEMSPRSRVRALIDPGSDSFLELGARTRSQRPEASDSSYGDGVVTAFGEIGGRMTAVIADDPIAMAQSDGGVGKNKRIRTLMQAAQGHLPVVYFANAVATDLPAPEEGGLLGRYSDGPLIVPETHFDDRSAPIITILGGEVAPEVESLALASDIVLATPGGASTPIPADLTLPDDASAIAMATTLLKLIPTRDSEALQALADSPAAAGGIGDAGASDAGAGALVEGICDGGSVAPFAADDDFAAGLGALNGYPMIYVVGGGVFSRPQLEIFRRVAGLGARFQMPMVMAQHGAAYDEEALGTAEYRRLVGEVAATIHGAETPKFSIISRRGQSGGDFILGGRELGFHYVVAWPDADVSTSEASPFTAARASAIEGIGPWEASGLALVDDVIAPTETRDRLSTMIEIMSPMRALPPVIEDKRGRIPYR